MIDEILRLRAELEAVKSVLGKLVTVGVVTEVDPARGYRIDLGEGTEGRLVSPWLPHPESGGQTASWVPLSKGQIVSILSPSGDLRQGLLLRGGFGGENTPPSQDMEANVLEALGVRFQMKDGTFTIEGDVVVDGNVDFRGGHVRHNETNIGDTHRHTDVKSGASLTGHPAN